MSKQTSVSQTPKAIIGSRKTSDLSAAFSNAAANALATAREELQTAAKAHGVKIKADRVVYASLEKTTIVHVPLAGIEKYKDADFAAGAPVQLVIVKSTAKGEIPDGAYVVKAQYRPGAKSGKAIFTDRTGAVIAQRNLIVRTVAQSAVLFPGVYPDDPGPQNIPVITSTHCFEKSPGDWAVDCAGWIPYRVFYY
jgi:hypothetical protein